MSKKYYWLKLKRTFFNQKEIKRLRKLAGGDTYTIIYLKMLLLSLENEGKIYFDEIGEDFVDELALDIDEENDNVKMTLSYLFSKELIETVNEKEYFLNEIPQMIGSESKSTSRVRRHRQQKKPEPLHCNADVTLSNSEETKSNTEKEKELETELDLDIEKEQQQECESEIIKFWNQNGFGQNNVNAKEQLLLWLKDTTFKNPEEIIIRAMQTACANNKRHLKYVEGILRNWKNQNLTTLESIEKQGNKQNLILGNTYDENLDRF